MRRDVLLEKLCTEGVNIEPVRLLSWERRKLIPPCYARDGSVHWPDETWWEAVAAAYLLDTCGWTESEVGIGRFYMEEVLAKGTSPIAKLDWLASAYSGGSIQAGENYQDAFAWAVACVKAQQGWPLLAPAEITVHHRTAGLEFELEQSLEDRLREDGNSSYHPRDLFLGSSKGEVG